MHAKIQGIFLRVTIRKVCLFLCLFLHSFLLLIMTIMQHATAAAIVEVVFVDLAAAVVVPAVAVVVEVGMQLLEWMATLTV